MSPEQLFKIAGTLVLPGWLLLAFLPRWKWSQRIAAIFIPLLIALVYLYLVLAHFRGAEGGFGSLAEVSRLFTNPHMLLAGWIHYLAFDLFIGAWETRDAARLKIPHLLVIPCLLLTFLLGPIGLLLYFGLRTTLRRKFDVLEA